MVEEVTFGGRIELARPLPLNQNFQEEREEIEIFLRRWQRKRVDLEIPGFQADANIRSAEKLREAFKAPAQVEDERVWIVFLEISDQKVKRKLFPAPVRPRIMVCATSR